VPAPPDEGWVRVRLDLAYRGTSFRGFAANPGVRTVLGSLQTALERVLGEVRDLVGAGRTDAGVHARAQVVSLDAPADRLDPERLRRSLNRQLAPDVVVRSVAVAEPSFHARFSAVSRTYRYRVLAGPDPDPLRMGTVWHVPESLDRSALRQACPPLVGSHDFGAFCRRPPPRPDGSRPTTVRRVFDAGWDFGGGGDDADGGLLVFEITASAFCHRMVRSIVGTLIEVGRGRLSTAEVVRILAVGDRRAVRTLAPPDGLVLWSVAYPDQP
jgi:tRNA pseudouridine38-40 synthase